MSKLDKEQVLADFTEAYKQAYGKKPKIEAKGGWYSVDGGKNVRLAQLAEELKTLKGSSKDKPTAPKPGKKPAAQSPEKPKVNKKAKAKSSGSGMTARELWRKKLEEGMTISRLPRGQKS
ncbi:hypothetical protein [Pseudidiomarina sp.]|uniref:hypothetical protein n=1 Tax=Pseudidiomarina sp. TaxID=2081707 RepID=UPI00299D1CE5|nr:hypothetical protein [Pseudidiomarina sp.]MDX1705537.1 hypothetical protein [Pseudidiomarina sp.]